MPSAATIRVVLHVPEGLCFLTVTASDGQVPELYARGLLCIWNIFYVCALELLTIWNVGLLLTEGILLARILSVFWNSRFQIPETYTEEKSIIKMKYTQKFKENVEESFNCWHMGKMKFNCMFAFYSGFHLKSSPQAPLAPGHVL